MSKIGALMKIIQIEKTKSNINAYIIDKKVLTFDKSILKDGKDFDLIDSPSDTEGLKTPEISDSKNT